MSYSCDTSLLTQETRRKKGCGCPVYWWRDGHCHVCRDVLNAQESFDGAVDVVCCCNAS